MSSNPGPDAPLPPGWSKGYSKSQHRNYYFHAKTKHTQWHFPTASEASDPLKAKRRAEMNAKRQSGSLGTIVSEIKVEARPVKRARSLPLDPDEDTTADRTSVAIIVPFRDLHANQHRAEHLREFVPHMHKFLTSQKKVSSFHIYIIEQSNDSRKFNRGKLLNIGFDLARKSGRNHDVFIFHDVDLLPTKELGEWYARFPKVPIHIARVWDRYSNNPKYFGGVVSFSSSDYKRINGYPNNFWGWGGEDDEMHKRLEKLRLEFDAPTSGQLVDLEDMELDEKLEFLRDNRKWKCLVKDEALAEHDATWKTNGLADLKYRMLERTALGETNTATKYTVDVKLNGDKFDAKSHVDDTRYGL